MDSKPYLIVVSGLPGTGKTTLSRALAQELGAVFIRVDVIETAIGRSGISPHPLGPVGYLIAREIALSNLKIDNPVVVDAVNPVAEARASWRELSDISHLILFETKLPNIEEHRRIIENRKPDLEGQHLPSWEDVLSLEYNSWDEKRDGHRHEIDTSIRDLALHEALHYIHT